MSSLPIVAKCLLAWAGFWNLLADVYKRQSCPQTGTAGNSWQEKAKPTFVARIPLSSLS